MALPFRAEPVSKSVLSDCIVRVAFVKWGWLVPHHGSGPEISNPC